ncbi:MAG: hypothetical protein JWQ87_1829 [Candidatus Sulfotelmatobacter sp.]|nr:hypothetical protein [Candidatus Sulfotelmatobacter sp.]
MENRIFSTTTRSNRWISTARTARNRGTKLPTISISRRTSFDYVTKFQQSEGARSEAVPGSHNLHEKPSSGPQIAKLKLEGTVAKNQESSEVTFAALGVDTAVLFYTPGIH